MKKRNKLFFTADESAASKLVHAAGSGGSVAVETADRATENREEDKEKESSEQALDSGFDGTKYSTKYSTKYAAQKAEHASYGKKLNDESSAAAKAARRKKLKTEEDIDPSDEDPSELLYHRQQKRSIKKEYAAAKRAETAAIREGTEETTAESAGAVKQAAGMAESGVRGLMGRMAGFFEKGFSYMKRHPQVVILCASSLVLLLCVSASLSSCSAFLPGGSGAVVSTTYTASDEEIIAVNEDYKALEAGLQNQIDNITTDHPGYDEYKFELAEIGHNPNELASYLTVLFEDYDRSRVQTVLHALFELQYELTLEEETETRYRTETRTGTRTVTDPETGEQTEEEYEYEEEVPYDYHILNVTLTNHNLGHVISESGGMDADQKERYAVLLRGKGNKPELFADDPYADRGDYEDYDIPGEALSDVRFARMIEEAEKYLGYPYVWGGDSPSTSFDCSGFVSWVINHCGNGWSIGRLTANELKNYCDIIPPEAAEPGDLIFFEKTYNTVGASHVAIYVGNGMMLHCGNPITYASFETEYWKAHFYCFGRIPD